MAAASDIQTSKNLKIQKRRKALADFFRLHRERAGLELAEVAEVLEVTSIDTIRAYEAGEIDFPLEDIFTLTNLFNIPPDDVVALILEASSQQERA